MYLYRYTDDCTKGRVSRVEGKAVSKGPPPKSSRSFEETTYSSTDHLLGFFNKFRPGSNLSY